MDTVFPGGYALLIAVDQNEIPEFALPDVLKDVRALEATLTDRQRCAYDPANVRVVSGSESTGAGILAGLTWLQERLATDTSGNTTAFIYYSGHGERDPQGTYYFVPYDVSRDHFETSALAATVFAAAVGSLTPTRLLAVLDCCHAGGMNVKDRSSTGVLRSAPAPKDLLPDTGSGASPGAKGLADLGRGSGRATLSSSQGTQLSYIRSDRTMSIFTFHLIEALTGHAQPAAGATEVLVSDVMSHVTRKVPETVMAQYRKEQHPDFQISGNFPIALLLGGKGLQGARNPPAPIEPVAGDTITIGDIGNATGIAVGRGASATVTTTRLEKDDPTTRSR